MERVTELKSIIHSKRANLYYLEKCRVMVKDGRVVYLSEKSNILIIGIYLLLIQL